MDRVEKKLAVWHDSSRRGAGDVFWFEFLDFAGTQTCEEADGNWQDVVC